MVYRADAATTDSRSHMNGGPNSFSVVESASSCCWPEESLERPVSLVTDRPCLHLRNSQRCCRHHPQGRLQPSLRHVSGMTQDPLFPNRVCGQGPTLLGLHPTDCSMHFSSDLKPMGNIGNQHARSCQTSWCWLQLLVVLESSGKLIWTPRKNVREDTTGETELTQRPTATVFQASCQRHVIEQMWRSLVPSRLPGSQELRAPRVPCVGVS